MMFGLLAKKMGMTQVFIDEGVRVPVTVLQVKPNVIVGIRTEKRDGYSAVQLGTGTRREKLVSKPMLGFFKNKELEPCETLREFRVPQDKVDTLTVGQQFGVELLSETLSLNISGVSKGKGYAGVMKRHHFSGFPASHGTHETFRHGGSIGCRAQPGKVQKGKRMAGQMGNERATTLNLRIVRIMPEEGLVLIHGAVPGAKGALLELRASSHKPRALGHVSAAIDEGPKNPLKASKQAAKSGTGKKK